MALICLDYFKYEWAEPPKKAGNNTVFHNCTILRAFGKYVPGQVVDAIGVQCIFFLWADEVDFEEEVVAL